MGVESRGPGIPHGHHRYIADTTFATGDTSIPWPMMMACNSRATWSRRTNAPISRALLPSGKRRKATIAGGARLIAPTYGRPQQERDHSPSRRTRQPDRPCEDSGADAVARLINENSSR